jgi:hypothetical protein
MADKQAFSVDGLRKLKNRIMEGDLTPGALADKFGTKDAVMAKANEVMDFLNRSAPDPKADAAAFEEWKSVKNVLERNFSTGMKYAPTMKKDSPYTNMDELSEKGYTKVAAKDEAGKILEKEAAQINELKYRDAQRLGQTSIPNARQVQELDIADAKRKALMNMGGSAAKRGLKSVAGALPLVGAAMAFGGAREAGASVPEAIARAAQEEATTPIVDALLPSSISEDKELSPEQVAQYQAEMRAKSDEAKAKSEERQANALEFGEKFNDMQNIRRNTLKRMSERQ